MMAAMFIAFFELKKMPTLCQHNLLAVFGLELLQIRKALFALCKGICQEAGLTMGKGSKARKPMKAVKKDESNKALNKGSPEGQVKKKPVAGPQTLALTDPGMSLEEKMEQFSKKANGNVNDFLDGLTSGQREALWGRFSRARDSLKDPTVTTLWNTHCKGQGSDAKKKKMLKVFLENQGDLKKGHFQKELTSLCEVEGCLASGLFVFECFSQFLKAI